MEQNLTGNQYNPIIEPVQVSQQPASSNFKTVAILLAFVISIASAGFIGYLLGKTTVSKNQLKPTNEISTNANTTQLTPQTPSPNLQNPESTSTITDGWVTYNSAVLTFKHPAGLEVGDSNPNYFSLMYLGPGNEGGSDLTDGYKFDITVHTDEGSDVDKYVAKKLGQITEIGTGRMETDETTETTIDGDRALQYIVHSDIFGDSRYTAIVHAGKIFAIEEAYPGKSSENISKYKNITNEILKSLKFN